MSVKAYLIKANDYEKLPNGDHKSVNTVAGDPTFNCWHDWDLIEDIADTERYDNGGEIYIEADRVKTKMAEIKEELKSKKLEVETRETMQEWLNICEDVLADIKSTGETCAEYECY